MEQDNHSEVLAQRAVGLVERAADRIRAESEHGVGQNGVGLGARPVGRPGLGGAGTIGARRRSGGIAKGGMSVSIDFVAMQLVGFVTPNSGSTRLAEEFRILKRPLLIKAKSSTRPDSRDHVIMVSSAKPSEGKTFTTVNLGMSIASEPDLNVLMIDADPHKPGLTSLLGIDAKVGLTNLLTEDSIRPEEVLVNTNAPNLAVIPSGPAIPNTTELLASNRMAEILNEFRRLVPDPIIVMDSPPVLASSEPSVLVMHAGQTVMVVEANGTSQRAVREAVEKLEMCDDIKFVLNKAAFRIGSDRFGSYKYYGYYR